MLFGKGASFIIHLSLSVIYSFQKLIRDAIVIYILSLASKSNISLLNIYTIFQHNKLCLFNLKSHYTIPIFLWLLFYYLLLLLVWFTSFSFLFHDPCSSYFSLSSADFPGRSSWTCLSAVLRGLRLWDPGWASPQSYSFLHPRPGNQLCQVSGEMGTLYHGSPQKGVWAKM